MSSEPRGDEFRLIRLPNRLPPPFLHRDDTQPFHHTTRGRPLGAPPLPLQVSRFPQIGCLKLELASRAYSPACPAPNVFCGVVTVYLLFVFSDLVCLLRSAGSCMRQSDATLQVPICTRGGACFVVNYTPFP